MKREVARGELLGLLALLLSVAGRATPATPVVEGYVAEGRGSRRDPPPFRLATPRINWACATIPYERRPDRSPAPLIAGSVGRPLTAMEPPASSEMGTQSSRPTAGERHLLPAR